ncbi:class I adenylate-forming enzyme family protein [Melghirimyces algeriensis]|uniref:O-succinylbenzoate-CoA ligase n=1 Tax=Melghirimyces algeriensis TaxID=910412 RepID=A0A521C101_9BACL|nr:AMP-binding protein [Melghirimyces algeriensis]SMO52471.1 O-succinylbenzoate-CoA ligase [Melghirimyces algeriensis]
MNVIGELLRDRSRLNPDLEAVVEGTKRLSFKEYNETVNQLAHYLLERKVEKGDRVALLCKNSAAFLLVYMAAAKVGAITVPVNWRLKPDEIQWILHDSGAKVLFYDDSLESGLPSLDRLEAITTDIRVFEEKFPDALTMGLSTEEPEVLVEETDPALIIYTSGTTGRPKGVVCTHANVFAAAMSNSYTLDQRFKDRFLFVTPLFHISGMVLSINALMEGITVVLRPTFHPVDLWETIESERITGMMSVPSMLPFMLEMIKNSDKDVSSLRSIVCGGSRVPEDLIQEFYELGFPIIQVYGATEFTGAITYWMPDMGPMDRCDSVGKGLYLTDIRILDPITHEPMLPGEVGEIVCRGKQVFLGYWNNKEETENVLKNGWYHTRDVGKLDADGFLYVIDRLRDMIICSGEKVFPAEVESVVVQLDGVSEVAVIGVEDPVWGEIPRAYVVKEKESHLTEEMVISHARNFLADYKLQQVEFVEELPKNSMGKVLKYVLREYAN